MTKTKKLTVVFLLLALASIIFIFSNSMQNGAESIERSERVTRMIQTQINRFHELFSSSNSSDTSDFSNSSDTSSSSNSSNSQSTQTPSDTHSPSGSNSNESSSQNSQSESEKAEKKVLENLDKKVRKLAHLTEFTMLGICASALMLFVYSISGKVHIGITLFACLFVGVLDEFIQVFSKRSSSVKDVMLDFSGTCLGMLIAYIVYILARRISNRKKQTDKSNKSNKSDNIKETTQKNEPTGL